MNITDVLTAPWAIEPGKLLELQAIYSAHVRGEKIDIAAVEQRLGRPLANDQRNYEIVDGVAIIPIEGVVAKKMNMFSQISGGASSQLARASLDQANSDPAVHSIILSIDSPGGTVDGTQILADAIRASRDGKPTVTLGGGTMASAAYWFGCAASAVYIADTTTSVGSIGIVASHVDISGAEAARGVKTTEISAGKYKRVASQYGPLSDDGRQSIQDQLDYMYSLFVGAVANNRGVSVEKVLKNMADGRVFIGEQAVAAGLVDGVSTLGALIAQLNAKRAGVAQPSHSATLQGADMSLTREQLAAQAPELMKALIAECVEKGAAAERARIQAVEGQSIPGHEALIATLKFDGKSTAGDAAMAVNAAERAQRQAHAQAQAGDAPNPVPLVPGATVTPAAGAEAERIAALPLEERCKAQWDSAPKLRSEFSSLAAFTAFTRADEDGRARILKR